VIAKIFTRIRVQVWIVIGLGFLLRFILAASPEVEIDETAFAQAALSYLKGNFFENVAFGHPMFMKLLFAGSAALFGADGRAGTLFPWLPESIGALRLVSVVLGSATCLIVYCLVKEATGRHIIAIIPCILLAFEPMSIAESSYGILDPGTTFFYMASILFFYRYIAGGRGWNFYASAILFGLSVASKYFAFMGIFVLIGMMLWKRKTRSEWKPMAVFLLIAVIAFFLVQPYLWSDQVIVNLSRSLSYDWGHLQSGHSVKRPGNPFLIPKIQLNGNPWPYLSPSNPIASKPDFYALGSEAVPSPWWYLLYIQSMYSTPFQILIYPVAICKMIRSIFHRQTTDLVVMGTLLALIPTLWFAFMNVRLPQYTVLPSTSSVVLGSVAFLHLSRKNEKHFLVMLGILHVSWTLVFLLTSADRFSGWGFYYTPMTPLIADLFHLLWALGFSIR